MNTATTPAPLTTSTAPMSDAQKAYLRNLIDQIGALRPGRVSEIKARLNADYLGERLTRSLASTRINQLKAERDDLRAYVAGVLADERVAPRAPEPRPDVLAGRYAVDNEQGVLTFYRVAVKDGHYTVYTFASAAQHRIQGWKATRAILRKIEAVGVESAGMKFADERGECRDCGRVLTDAQSRKDGRGPICSGKRAA